MLIVIVAKFNLEILQFNTVNIFANIDLDKIVFIKMPLGYIQFDQVLKLNKALYDLHRSSLLWQQKFANKIRRLGFNEIP